MQQHLRYGNLSLERLNKTGKGRIVELMQFYSLFNKAYNLTMHSQSAELHLWVCCYSQGHIDMRTEDVCPGNTEEESCVILRGHMQDWIYDRIIISDRSLMKDGVIWAAKLELARSCRTPFNILGQTIMSMKKLRFEDKIRSRASTDLTLHMASLYSQQVIYSDTHPQSYLQKGSAIAQSLVLDVTQQHVAFKITNLTLIFNPTHVGTSFMSVMQYLLSIYGDEAGSDGLTTEFRRLDQRRPGWLGAYSWGGLGDAGGQESLVHHGCHSCWLDVLVIEGEGGIEWVGWKDRRWGGVKISKCGWGAIPVLGADLATNYKPGCHRLIECRNLLRVIPCRFRLYSCMQSWCSDCPCNIVAWQGPELSV